MQKSFFVLLVLTSVLFSNSVSASQNNMIKHTCIEKKEVTEMALDSMVMVQTIVKGYLYDHSETVLDQKMKNSLLQLDRMVHKLGMLTSENVEVQRCLDILPISVAELRAALKEKNINENDHLVVDLATVITQAVIGIAKGVENELVAYKADSNPLDLRLSSL
jgi:hypothetical protein